ncbi:hypothetical protein QA648_27995 (plasmid) [Rhizobium sp. CB3171]|uniref:hypothetical protein n=1 Tax=Rhizobium sp. CB3171 TaxID=3039157 RepID=UPI0024B181FF|nr:hypothetical protein [Rhizobium sp. CB3171]WFU04620.1 hypothetical protein QA648_27995 [Rhizobium sp. CB3171]
MMQIVNLPSCEPINGCPNVPTSISPTFGDIQITEILEHERQKLLIVANYLEAMYVQMLAQAANKPLIKVVAD